MGTLSGLPLSSLNLRGNPIRDFRLLAEFPLRKPALNRTGVTDADVLVLYQLKSLEIVCMRDLKITAANIAALQQACSSVQDRVARIFNRVASRVAGTA